jgi:hypothetical protein
MKMKFSKLNLYLLFLLILSEITQTFTATIPDTNVKVESTNQTSKGKFQTIEQISVTDEQLNSFPYGEEEFKLAVIGDSGTESEAREVMKLTTFDALLHLGDFDYSCKPDKYFNEILDSNRSYQFMGILGNHEGVSQCGLEVNKQFTNNVYNEMISKKNDKVKCEFSPSKVMWACVFHNMRIIGLSSGVNGADKRNEQLSFLKKHLNKSTTEDWKICSWHFYDKYYHTGKYPEDDNIISGSGESFYDYCKDHGAIIFSAHDHVYARTHVMTEFKKPTIDKYDMDTSEDIVQIRNGATLDILNGAGGYEIYIEQGEQKNYSHWQKKYAKGSSNENAEKFGGLFCTFNYGGNNRKANCKFLRINSSNKLFDSFNIYRNDDPSTITYEQIDNSFKDEKIKAFKIANNISLGNNPDENVSASDVNNNNNNDNNNNNNDNDNDNNNIIDRDNNTTTKSNYNTSKKLFTTQNIIIGGSLCAVLIFLGGGLLMFNNKYKIEKSDDHMLNKEGDTYKHNKAFSSTGQYDGLYNNSNQKEDKESYILPKPKGVTCVNSEINFENQKSYNNDLPNLVTHQKQTIQEKNDF